MQGVFFDETPNLYDEKKAEFLETVTRAVKNATGIGDGRLVSRFSFLECDCVAILSLGHYLGLPPSRGTVVALSSLDSTPLTSSQPDNPQPRHNARRPPHPSHPPPEHKALHPRRRGHIRKRVFRIHKSLPMDDRPDG